MRTVYKHTIDTAYCEYLATVGLYCGQTACERNLAKINTSSTSFIFSSSSSSSPFLLFLLFFLFLLLPSCPAYFLAPKDSWLCDANRQLESWGSPDGKCTKILLLFLAFLDFLAFLTSAMEFLISACNSIHDCFNRKMLFTPTPILATRTTTPTRITPQ